MPETPQQTYERQSQEYAWLQEEESKRRADRKREAERPPKRPARIGLTASGRGKPRREGWGWKWGVFCVVAFIVVRGFF